MSNLLDGNRFCVERILLEPALCRKALELLQRKGLRYSRPLEELTNEDCTQAFKALYDLTYAAESAREVS